MSAGFNVSELPNPFTPSAFLPPDLAYQTDIARYILIGGLACLVWDILSNLGADYQLLFKHPVRLPTIVYFFSRYATLYYCLSSTIFETAAVGLGRCKPFEKALDVGFPLSVASTALLFFFRAKAIFSGNRYMICFFFFMWLSVLAGSLTVPFAVTGGNIGPTPYCLNVGLEPYAAAAAIIPLVHDTIIWSCISWRLLISSHIDYKNYGPFEAIASIASGRGLPAFSRALFYDGQLYYLITVGSNLLVIIMLYVGVPPTFGSMFTVPNLFLCNAMACLVFRKAKLGLIRDSASGANTSQQHGSRSGYPLSQLSQPNRTERGDGHIIIGKTVEEYRDYSGTQKSAFMV